MSGTGQLELLFQHAANHRFGAFARLFEKLAPGLPGDALGDACLLRAQIKLFAADARVAEDLEQAAAVGGAPRFPCLGSLWLYDSPNRFIVFRDEPGALSGFLQLLPQAGAALARFYGDAGRAMARQVQSEILYFTGAFGEAIAIAQEAHGAGKKNGAGAIQANYVLFRCYLATGEAKLAQQCMLDMIGLVRDHPECLDAYLVIRAWANLTTGWSGDNPRFLREPDGEAVPVFEDRIEAIRQGISHMSALEKPFAEIAEASYRPACTMRQHYMDIFNAIYWFHAGDDGQMEPHFRRACQTAAAGGLIMPFVEYGAQIVPLLRHAGRIGLPCPADWVARVSALAGRYEESLNAYRA